VRWSRSARGIACSRLLDRLTDHDPGRKVEGPDRAVPVASAESVRLRNLTGSSIRRTSRAPSTCRPIRSPAQSTLNYG